MGDGARLSLTLRCVCVCVCVRVRACVRVYAFVVQRYCSPVYSPSRMHDSRLVNISGTRHGDTPPPDLFARHSSMADTFETSFRASRTVLVTDYGATGDGSTDDTAAFERAIAAAGAAGTASSSPSCVGCVGVVAVPAGTYVISRTLHLPDTSPVALAGVSLRSVVLTTPPGVSDFDGPLIQTGVAPCVLRDLFLVYYKHQPSA
jgi:hypothetical protein